MCTKEAAYCQESSASKQASEHVRGRRSPCSRDSAVSRAVLLREVRSRTGPLGAFNLFICTVRLLSHVSAPAGLLVLCSAEDGRGSDARAEEAVQDGELSLEREASPVWAGVSAALPALFLVPGAPERARSATDVGLPAPGTRTCCV